MSRLTRKLAARGTAAAREAYERVETRVLVSAGRKAVRNKVRAVGKVSRKAVKTGLVGGALTAAGVVVQEIRTRRKLDA